MKILKISLISLCALVSLLLIGAVVFVKTFDVNKFKPQIAGAVKSALNRDMDFKNAKLDITLSRGISLDISDVYLGENPAFGKEDFLRIKKISVGIDAAAYLFGKKISIPAVFIDSPRIVIIRTKEGAVNAASFSDTSVQADASAQAQNVSSPASMPPPAVLPALMINSVKIAGGEVTYIDRSFEPPVSLAVKDIGLYVKDISLTGPFSFHLEACVIGSGKNIEMDGKAKLDLASGGATVFDYKCSADLSAFALDKIPASLPMLKDTPLPQSLKGKLTLGIDKLSAGAKGLSEISAGVVMSGGEVEMKELASAVKDMNAKVNITQSDVAIDSLAFSIGQGAVKCRGRIEDYLAKQRFSVKADVAGMKAQDIVPQDKMPVKIEGALTGPIQIEGAGFAGQSLMDSIIGKADMSVTDAKLKDVNVMRIILDQLSVIPGLSQSVEAGLPEDLKQKLAVKDTVFTQIKLPANIENKNVFIKDAVIASDDFEFKGSAQSSFSGEYSLEGSFFIEKAFSAAIVSAVAQMRYLMNEEKRVFIPLKISGSAAGGMKFVIDADYIGKKLLENQAKQQIFKALDKALGPGANSASGQEDPESASGGASAAKEAIGNILSNIFK